MKRIKSALRTALYAIVGFVSTASFAYQLYLIYFLQLWKHLSIDMLWVATTLYCITMPIIGAYVIYLTIKSSKYGRLQMPALSVGSCLLLLILLTVCLLYHISISALLFSNAQFDFFTQLDYLLLTGMLSSTVLLFCLDVLILCIIIHSMVTAARNGRQSD